MIHQYRTEHKDDKVINEGVAQLYFSTAQNSSKVFKCKWVNKYGNYTTLHAKWDAITKETNLAQISQPMPSPPHVDSTKRCRYHQNTGHTTKEYYRVCDLLHTKRPSQRMSEDYLSMLVKLWRLTVTARVWVDGWWWWRQFTDMFRVTIVVMVRVMNTQFQWEWRIMFKNINFQSFESER